MDPTAQDLIARLRQNPDDSEAFAALRAHYHRRGDYASLANLLEGWASRSPHARAAAAAFFEAGDLASTYLSDRGRAISLFERAVERDPQHIDASVRLQEAFEEVNDHRRLLELLERRAAALGATRADPRHVAAVHHQIGDIWERRFKRVDQAVHHYRKAFELDPSLVAAIYSAREIYRGAGNIKAAATLYELETNAETDPKRRVALLRELAHMRAEQLKDLDGAIACLERAVHDASTDLGVVHDLATMLIRQAEGARDPRAALEGRRRAADLLYQMGQAVAPDHGLPYVESALDAAPDHDGAMELLEKLADATGREDLLPIRWVAYLQAAPDSPAAAGMRRRLSQAYAEAEQTEDAILCLEPLLEQGDAQAAEQLVELYRSSGREADVVRALSVAVAGLPATQRVPRLREIVEILKGEGDMDGAAGRAREILQIDPTDPEALTFLEDLYRQRNEFDALRDLLLSAARVSGLSVEARKLRLREVAAICEQKLGDQSGAISAWRAVSALDPADGDSRRSLQRLLEAAGRWDELVQVFEREALTVTDPDTKAEIYRRLAHLHRDRRDSPMEAVEALRSLRELRPGDVAARDDLCDVLLTAGLHQEAVPMLRERIDGASAADERMRLLRLLASVLEEELRDDEGAFDACARLLDEEPGDLDSLDRMERIDTRAERWDRLVETLSYRTEVVADNARAEIFSRMGRLADSRLGDMDRAAEYYGKALDLAPADTSILDALCSVYDRAERFRDLVVLLRQRAEIEAGAAARAELYRRIARILAERVRNEDAAAEAWQEVLEAGDDEEALRFLRSLAYKRDDAVELSDIIRRLTGLIQSPAERRDLLFERAGLLAERLHKPQEAIVLLRELVDDLDPSHVPALNLLAELCATAQDHVGLADALERQLALTEDDGLRVPLAERLADLYESKLSDSNRAIEALYAWADADLTDLDPQRRLARLLEAAGRWKDLVGALDALAGLEQDPTVVSDLVRRSARVSLERLGDVDGAWERLVPQVEGGDTEAEHELRSVAKSTSRGESLAELYVEFAQAATSPEEQRQRWTDAADVFEEFLGDANRALESMLRAFAVDLANREVLAEVDRMAVAAGAGQRLAQVYDTLLRHATDDREKADLLVRHAALVDREEMNPSGALDRILRACALMPDDGDILARAEELAPRSGRAEELLIVYDRLRARADEDAQRVKALLRSAHLCDLSLEDRERAMTYIAQAVALAARTPELAPDVEAAVAKMDDDRPELGPGVGRRTLVELYRQLAERAAEDAPLAAGQLLSRGARMLLEDMNDERRAFEFQKLASTYAPADAEVLERLEQMAERSNRMNELSTHLENLIDEVLDQSTAVALLRRRGRLLAETLVRPSEAAEVYRRLQVLRPDEVDVSDRLQQCLRKADQHQDLLVVLEREMEHSADPDRRVVLLKAIAKTWEQDLKNRWEALEAWQRVKAEVPTDPEATEAIDRLGHSTRRLSADELDAGGDSGAFTPEPMVAPHPPIPFEGTGEITDPGPDAARSVFDTDEETELEGDDDLLAPLAAPTAGLGPGAPMRPWESAEEALLGAFAQEEPTDKAEKARPARREGTAEIDLSEIEEVKGLEPADDSFGDLTPTATPNHVADALEGMGWGPAKIVGAPAEAEEVHSIDEISGMVELPDSVEIEDLLIEEDSFEELDGPDLLDDDSGEEGPHERPSPAGGDADGGST